MLVEKSLLFTDFQRQTLLAFTPKCNSRANAIPDISGAGSPKCAGGVGPGIIGNCICPGIAFGGEREYLLAAEG